jgi:hypothetical protein
VIQSVGAAISGQSVFDAVPASTGFFGPDDDLSAVARSDVEGFSEPEDPSRLDDPSLPDDPSVPEDPSPPEDPSLPEDPSVAALADEPAAVGAAWRSFFAQPEPLKWTAGALIALRTGPLPHNGQVEGPSTWTPCTTSNRRPHAAQS